jgi:hypothetical protein
MLATTSTDGTLDFVLSLCQQVLEKVHLLPFTNMALTLDPGYAGVSATEVTQ